MQLVHYRPLKLTNTSNATKSACFTNNNSILSPLITVILQAVEYECKKGINFLGAGVSLIVPDN